MFRCKFALGIFCSVVTILTPLSAVAKNSFAILAMSWQPAFCEQRSDRPECATQTPTRYDATHFSLHGLWPGPRSRSYCNVSSALIQLDKSGRWGSLPNLRLDAALASRLNQIMPGTRSFLQRHEWVKHGSCHEQGSTNGYYNDSLRLMAEINASYVQRLFAENLTKTLDAERIRAAFDQAFGKGAGKRVKVKCKRDGARTLISEITIGLFGEFNEATSISRLILAANPTSPGCKGGIVDGAGLQ